MSNNAIKLFTPETIAKYAALSARVWRVRRDHSLTTLQLAELLKSDVHDVSAWLRGSAIPTKSGAKIAELLRAYEVGPPDSHERTIAAQFATEYERSQHNRVTTFRIAQRPDAPARSVKSEAPAQIVGPSRFERAWRRVKRWATTSRDPYLGFGFVLGFALGLALGVLQ